MKSIWVFDGPDWVAFVNEDDILPSIKLSYSKLAHTVEFLSSNRDANGGWRQRHYKVTTDNGVAILTFREWHLSDEPTHL